jgi:hypothetical protein
MGPTFLDRDASGFGKSIANRLAGWPTSAFRQISPFMSGRPHRRDVHRAAKKQICNTETRLIARGGLTVCPVTAGILAATGRNS